MPPVALIEHPWLTDQLENLADISECTREGEEQSSRNLKIVSRSGDDQLKTAVTVGGNLLARYHAKRVVGTLRVPFPRHDDA
jgi:hypothetical protein